MLTDRNEHGYRVGQSSGKAKLTDRDIELIFELRDEGLTIMQIAEKMECGRTTVWKILNGVIRGQGVGVQNYFERKKPQKMTQTPEKEDKYAAPISWPFTPLHPGHAQKSSEPTYAELIPADGGNREGNYQDDERLPDVLPQASVALLLDYFETGLLILESYGRTKFSITKPVAIEVIKLLNRPGKIGENLT